MITVRGTGFFAALDDPKDPLVGIELYAGRFGTIPPVVRPRPSFTATNPVSDDGTFEETVVIATADAYVCAHGVVTVIASSEDRAVAYYLVK